jgi:MEMO1 family protein
MTNHMRFHDSWYPADPARLAALLAVRPGEVAVRPGEIAGVPLLAVLPHAGLTYSARGQRAFWGRWAAADAPFDAVVIVAPSHYVPLPADTTVAVAFDRHETPFGDLPGLALAGDRPGPADRETVEGEHAVELLLPGIAYTLGHDLPVGAVLVGTVSGAAAARAAASRLLDRLDALGVRRPLWLVSSDGTHYGRRFRWQPWGDGTWRELAEQVYADDAELIGAGIAGRNGAFWERLQRPATVCGRYALGLALAALEIEEERGRLHREAGTFLEYYSSAGDLDGAGSGRDDGDAREFVCYATAEITGEWRTS